MGKSIVKWSLIAFSAAFILGAGWIVNWSIAANQEIDQLEVISAETYAPGQFVTVAGRKLHVLVKGDLGADPTGAPLLLLHGFSVAGHKTWFPWADRLAAERTIIVPDLLGFGHSERVTDPHQDLTHEGQARLVKGLLDALGVAKVDLVGWSFGGAVASETVLDYPDAVRSLALVAAHVYYTEDNNPWEWFGALPYGLGRTFVWNSIGGGPSGWAARACTSDPSSCDRHQITLIKNTVDGLRAINRLRQISRVPYDLAQIKTRALVFWGEDDPIVPLEDGIRLAEEINAAELHVIPQADHTPHAKEPQKAVRILLDFFAKGI